MSEQCKSALVVNPSKKESNLLKTSGLEVEYKQVSNSNDFIGELSDQEKEAEFNRQHEEYIKMKINRKKELIRAKREEFGTSSSDQPESSSDEEISENKPVKKVEAKRSKGNPQSKPHQEQTIYPVTLELKKLNVDTELIFLDREFVINKRTLPYSKIIRIHLLLSDNEKANKRKVKIALIDEELTITYNDKEEASKDKSIQIFIRILRVKLEAKEVKFYQLERKTSAMEYTSQQMEDVIAFDKLYKKSQIIGTWQQRYVIIKQDGLYSYRSLKSKPTMYISMKEMKELQTQFQPFKDLVVVKLIYSTTKTDFGLPTDNNLEWVSHFAKLISRE